MAERNVSLSDFIPRGEFRLSLDGPKPHCWIPTVRKNEEVSRNVLYKRSSKELFQYYVDAVEPIFSPGDIFPDEQTRFEILTNTDSSQVFSYNIILQGNPDRRTSAFLFDSLRDLGFEKDAVVDEANRACLPFLQLSSDHGLQFSIGDTSFVQILPAANEPIFPWEATDIDLKTPITLVREATALYLENTMVEGRFEEADGSQVPFQIVSGVYIPCTDFSKIDEKIKRQVLHARDRVAFIHTLAEPYIKLETRAA